MTEQVKGLYVALEENVNHDDIEGLVNAIIHLKNVLCVEKNVTSFDDYVIKSRTKVDLARRIFRLLEEFKEF